MKNRLEEFFKLN